MASAYEKRPGQYWARWKDRDGVWRQTPLNQAPPPRRQARGPTPRGSDEGPDRGVPRREGQGGPLGPDSESHQGIPLPGLQRRDPARALVRKEPGSRDQAAARPEAPGGLPPLRGGRAGDLPGPAAALPSLRDDALHRSPEGRAPCTPQCGHRLVAHGDLGQALGPSRHDQGRPREAHPHSHRSRAGPA